MKSSEVAFYRVGIRVGQALEFCRLCASVMPRGTAAAMRECLSNLVIALEALAKETQLEPVRTHGKELLERAIRDLLWASSPTHDIQPSVDTEVLLAEFQQLMINFLRIDSCRSRWKTCFELGLEIVQVFDAQKDPRPRPVIPRYVTKQPDEAAADDRPCPEPIWKWVHPERLADLTKNAEVPLAVLFPDVVVVDPMVHSNPASEYPAAWSHIEAGLETLLSGGAGIRHKHRPCHERDHEWLKWYNDPSSGVCNSPTKIMRRWNELHPGERVETADVVKQGLRKARREQENHLNLPPLK